MAENTDFASRLLGEEGSEGVDFASRVGFDPQQSENEAAAQLFGQRDFGPPGLHDFRARAAVAAADTFAEKRKAFATFFPHGRLERVPATGDLIFQRNKAEPFSKLDPSPSELSEFGFDVVDVLAGDVLPLAGEIGAAILSRGTSLLPFLVRTFAGVSLGEVAQEGVETLLGFGGEKPTDVASRAAAKGGFAVAAETAVAGGVSAFNIGTGRSGLGGKRTPEGERAKRAADALGVELSAAQQTDNTFIRILEAQAGVLPRFQEFYRNTRSGIASNIRGLRDTKALSSLIESTERAHAAMRDAILATPGVTRTELGEGGAALIRGVQTYTEQSGKLVGRLYDVARSIESPSFDLAPALDVANDLRKGTRGAARPIEGAEAGTVQVSDAASEQGLQAVIDDLLALDPALPAAPGTDAPVDVLRALRTRLYDLKTPAPGVPPDRFNHAASRLYSVLTDVLNKPVTGTKEGAAAWKFANAEAVKRYDTLDKIVIRETAKSETPTILAAKYAQPRQVDNIHQLQRTIPPDEFAKFQESFKTQLLDDSNNLTKRLDEFDQPTLGALLAPSEQTLLRQAGKDIDQLNLLDANGALLRQTRNRAFARDLIFGNLDKSAAVTALRKMGNKNSDAGKAIRAGIVDVLVEDALKSPADDVAKGIFDSRLKALRESGALRLLTQNDVQKLRSLRDILPAIKAAADVGSSLQRASTVAQVRGAITLNESVASGIATLLEHLGIGRLFLTPGGQKLLFGELGKEKVSGEFLRGFAGALAVGAEDLESMPDLESELGP